MDQSNKDSVVKFLLGTGALRFGEFTLKSGRIAPYFINTGCFDTAERISGLGAIYADHLMEHGLGDADTIFGPSYKGIPLCVATATALYQKFGRNIGFTFNRKEAKTRGEGGLFVGTPLSEGTETLIVEDVVSAGTTLREVVPIVRETGASIRGVVILVDRSERGVGDEDSAVREAEKMLDLSVSPIITVYDIVQYIRRPGSGYSGETADAIERYLEQYGCKK